MDRQMRLWERLHGEGCEAEAFEQLVRDGMDKRALWVTLVVLHNCWPRRPQAVLPRQDRDDLKRLARNLRWAAGELRRLSCFDNKLWKIELPLIPDKPDVVRLAQGCLEAAEFLDRLQRDLQHKRWSNTSHLVIRELVRDVQEKTGRPHYFEIALLCTAAYEDRPTFDPDTIKMIAARHK